MTKQIGVAAFVWTLALICVMSCTGEKHAREIQPVRNQGTISFVIETDRDYSNGYSDSLIEQTLVSLPGLGKCIFRRSYSDVRIHFMWDSSETHRGFQLTPSELPGPEKYSIILTWDADLGLSNGYFQGIPFRTEDSLNYTSWEVPSAATLVELGEGPLRVINVEVNARYSSEAEIRSLVPAELRDAGADILWRRELPAFMDVESRKGRLLYSSETDNDGGLERWIIEGPGQTSSEGDGIYVGSLIPDPPDGSTGHLNFWCSEEFPESFVAEWEFKPVSEYGLAGIFFAAKGENGEDLFDPVLPVRDGHYPQYHSGAIVDYFLFYYTNRKVNRTTDYSTTWLLKAHNVSNLAKGLIGVPPRVHVFSNLRLVKDGSRIQFSVNDRVALDFSDPGNERWGSVLGGGKIGFRQMARTVAAYRNFKVWELRQP